jgi:protein-disulfide isomerase
MKPALIGAAAAAIALAACNKSIAPAPSDQAGSALAASTVVATYSGKQVTLGQLDKEIAKDLYELRRQSLESMIIKNLVAEEAKAAGKTEDVFLREMAEKNAQKPDEAEVKKVYDEAKEQLGGMPYEQAKPMIEARLGQKKQQEVVLKYVDELKQKANVKITLQEPRTQVAATGPSKGPEAAKVTIVEFSDFQCPFCSKARDTADKVVTNYAGKVRLVFRDYPLPFHEKALKAAEAGQCANEQGKFWEMHDEMFAHQDKLALDDLKASAKKLGLDASKFDSCLDGSKYAEVVQQNLKAGQAAGVNGTPAFFVNGRMISGAQPFEKFKEIVDEELAK